jgi:hypothetical protein
MTKLQDKKKRFMVIRFLNDPKGQIFLKWANWYSIIWNDEKYRFVTASASITGTARFKDQLFYKEQQWGNYKPSGPWEVIRRKSFSNHLGSMICYTTGHEWISQNTDQTHISWFHWSLALLNLDFSHAGIYLPVEIDNFHRRRVAKRLWK